MSLYWSLCGQLVFCPHLRRPIQTASPIRKRKPKCIEHTAITMWSKEVEAMNESVEHHWQHIKDCAWPICFSTHLSSYINGMHLLWPVPITDQTLFQGNSGFVNSIYIYSHLGQSVENTCSCCHYSLSVWGTQNGADGG